MIKSDTRTFVDRSQHGSKRIRLRFVARQVALPHYAAEARKHRLDMNRTLARFRTPAERA